MPNKRRRLFIGAALVIIALVGLWFLFRQDRVGAGLELLRGNLSLQGKQSATAKNPESRSGTVKTPSRPVDSVTALSAEKRSSEPVLFTLEGRVLSDEGGLPGAHLYIFTGASSRDAVWPARTIVAGKGGAYRVQLYFVQNQGFRVRAEMVGFASREQVVLMQSEAGATIDFVLSRSASTLSGRVIDSEGKGIAGVQVEIQVPHRGRAEGAGFLFPDTRDGYSSTDGSFVFENLSPGPVSIEILPKNELPQVKRLELKPGKNTVEVRLPRSEELEVRVTNRGGRPLSNADVRTSWLNAGMIQAQTKSDGIARLRIPDLIDQKITLIVKAEGYLQKVVERPTRTTSLEVVLLEAGQLVGRVTTENAQPVPDCRVLTQAWITDGQDGTRVSTGGTARTDQDGRFSIEAVEFGRLLVSCKDFPSFARIVKAEDADRELSIVLKSQNSAILGQVVDPSGRPVTDFFISLEEAAEGQDTAAASEFQGSSLQNAFHDSQGRFSFPAVSAGVWMISAWSEDASLAAAPVRVELVPGQATEGVIIRVKPLN
ncbi:MAG: hypothetical protein EHM23_02955 [Acidobacteria bacterium]|nr:MAG: hypothetical protein EHM23_02955 [Acidobacteriota bacterium]